MRCSVLALTQDLRILQGFEARQISTIIEYCPGSGRRGYNSSRADAVGEHPCKRRRAELDRLASTALYGEDWLLICAMAD